MEENNIFDNELRNVDDHNIHHKPRKRLQTNVIIICILIVAILATSIYSRYKLSQQKIANFENSANLLAIALGPYFDLKDAVKVKNITVSLAKKGRFSLVLIADHNGQIAGATDRRYDQTIVRSLAKAPEEAKSYYLNNQLYCDVAIMNQRNMVGAIRLKAQVEN